LDVSVIMRLLEDGEEGVPTNHSFNMGLNGNTEHSDQYDTSDSESDIEEVEPVSATLVLRVFNEPSSPSQSRKSSFRRNQPPSFLNEEDKGETFLQVQVQKSTSSTSLTGPKSISRPPSATPSLYLTDAEELNSLEFRIPGERAMSPNMFGLQEIDLQKDVGVNKVEFMQKVSDQTKVIEQGLKTLRGEVDNPLRVLDIGQEAIVLSGLNRHAGESLKNIQNLYDETKYLKSYLEQVNLYQIFKNKYCEIFQLEADIQRKIELQRGSTHGTPWYKKLVFISLCAGAGAYAWRRLDQNSFERNLSLFGSTAVTAYTNSISFFTSKGPLKSEPFCLQQ